MSPPVPFTAWAKGRGETRTGTPEALCALATEWIAGGVREVRMRVTPDTLVVVRPRRRT